MNVFKKLTNSIIVDDMRRHFENYDLRDSEVDSILLKKLTSAFEKGGEDVLFDCFIENYKESPVSCALTFLILQKSTEKFQNESKKQDELKEKKADLKRAHAKKNVFSRIFSKKQHSSEVIEIDRSINLAISKQEELNPRHCEMAMTLQKKMNEYSKGGDEIMESLENKRKFVNEADSELISPIVEEQARGMLSDLEEVDSLVQDQSDLKLYRREKRLGESIKVRMHLFCDQLLRRLDGTESMQDGRDAKRFERFDVLNSREEAVSMFVEKRAFHALCDVLGKDGGSFCDYINLQCAKHLIDSESSVFSRNTPASRILMLINWSNTYRFGNVEGLIRTVDFAMTRSSENCFEYIPIAAIQAREFNGQERDVVKRRGLDFLLVGGFKEKLSGNDPTDDKIYAFKGLARDSRELAVNGDNPFALSANMIKTIAEINDTAGKKMVQHYNAANLPSRAESYTVRGVNCIFCERVSQESGISPDKMLDVAIKNGAQKFLRYSSFDFLENLSDKKTVELVGAIIKEKDENLDTCLFSLLSQSGERRSLFIAGLVRTLSVSNENEQSIIINKIKNTSTEGFDDLALNLYIASSVKNIGVEESLNLEKPKIRLKNQLEYLFEKKNVSEEFVSSMIFNGFAEPILEEDFISKGSVDAVFEGSPMEWRKSLLTKSLKSKSNKMFNIFWTTSPLAEKKEIFSSLKEKEKINLLERLGVVVLDETEFYENKCLKLSKQDVGNLGEVVACGERHDIYVRSHLDSETKNSRIALISAMSMLPYGSRKCFCNTDIFGNEKLFEDFFIEDLNMNSVYENMPKSITERKCLSALNGAHRKIIRKVSRVIPEDNLFNFFSTSILGKEESEIFKNQSQSELIESVKNGEKDNAVFSLDEVKAGVVIGSICQSKKMKTDMDFKVKTIEGLSCVAKEENRIAILAKIFDSFTPSKSGVREVVQLLQAVHLGDSIGMGEECFNSILNSKQGIEEMKNSIFANCNKRVNEILCLEGSEMIDFSKIENGNQLVPIIASIIHDDESQETKGVFKAISKSLHRDEFQSWRYSHELSQHQLRGLSSSQIVEWRKNSSTDNENHIIEESDEAIKLLNVGEDPQPTCLSHKGGVNKHALMSIAAHSNVKVAFAYKRNEQGERGKLIGRVIMRLVHDEKEHPYMLMEAVYSIEDYDQVTRGFKKYAEEKSSKTNIPILEQSNEGEEMSVNFGQGFGSSYSDSIRQIVSKTGEVKGEDGNRKKMAVIKGVVIPPNGRHRNYCSI